MYTVSVHDNFRNPFWELDVVVMGPLYGDDLSSISFIFPPVLYPIE